MSLLTSAAVSVYRNVKSATQTTISLTVCLVVAYAFGAVDEVARALLARALAAALGSRVGVGALELSLVAGRLECSRVTLDQWAGFPGDEAARCGGLTVEFDAAQLLRRRAVVCASARLRDVRACVARHASGVVNFALVDAKKRAAALAAVAPPAAVDAPVDDDWVAVDDVAVDAVAVEAPAPDYYDRAGEAPGLVDDAAREAAAKIVDDGARLWSLFRRSATSAAQKAEKAAADWERQTRAKESASASTPFEDVALSALDAARGAATALEETRKQAEAWGHQKAREALDAAIDAAFPEPPDEPADGGWWTLEVAGPVEVDRFELALVGADAVALLDPPVVVERLSVDGRLAAGLSPSRAVAKLLKLLARQALDRLLEDRPGEATRLARAVGLEASHAAERKAAAVARAAARSVAGAGRAAVAAAT